MKGSCMHESLYDSLNRLNMSRQQKTFFRHCSGLRRIVGLRERRTGFDFHEKTDYLKMQEPAVLLNVRIQNTGDFEGEDVILAYVDKAPEQKKNSPDIPEEYRNELDPKNRPVKSLCAFTRVALEAGEEKTVTLPVSAYSLTTVLENGRRVFLPGKYVFTVGDEKLRLRL